MSEGALDFIHDTSRPHVHGEVRTKIRALFTEIDALYKQHLRKSTNRKCDICGKGDNSEIFRVKDVVHGYQHRESESPCLCYNHACGWALSFKSLPLQKYPDDYIDLHFAQYVAKQLSKITAQGKNG
jgi:hypothetical protein